PPATGIDLAGDVFSVVGTERGHDPAIVVRLAHAPKRDSPDHRVLPFYGLFAFAEDGSHHRRVGRARADSVEQDVLARQLAGQRFGEGDQPALAGRVDGLIA